MEGRRYKLAISAIESNPDYVPNQYPGMMQQFPNERTIERKVLEMTISEEELNAIRKAVLTIAK